MTAALHIKDPLLRQLHAYWCRKRGDRVAPARAEIEPDEIRDLLPNVYIIEMLGAPHRFRFRLVGTSVVREYGAEITGKFLDEIDLDGMGLPVLSEYEKVVSEREPIASTWHFTKRDGRELSYEHLIMPLSSDGKTVDMLFAAAVGKGVGPVPPRQAG